MCMSGAETSWHLLGAYEVQSGELGLVRTVEVSLVSFSSEIITNLWNLPSSSLHVLEKCSFSFSDSFRK